MFSKLFLKYCSLALLINLQTSFLARLKVAQSTGLSEILAFFSSLSLFFMASLISVVNQFGWFLFFSLTGRRRQSAGLPCYVGSINKKIQRGLKGKNLRRVVQSTFKPAGRWSENVIMMRNLNIW